jgi:2-phospho-L-lactate guanylyltransferase
VTSWTALVPLKQAALRKSRLGERLSAHDRIRLSESLARHVSSTARAVVGVSAVVLLSDTPAAWEGVEWIGDLGRGLNEEIGEAAARLGNRPLVVLPADLPWLEREDVAAMIEAARCGHAIAPDRHDRGTNGLALISPCGFPFAFGEKSFAAHVEAAGQGAGIVRRPGLAFDIDTAPDLDLALEVGIPGYAVTGS